MTQLGQGTVGVASWRAPYGALRGADCLLCRSLADLADRLDGADVGGRPELSAYEDVYHAARELFGLTIRATRERLRIGRVLRHLPAIETAWLRGEVAYSRVREITRVASPVNEASWLELARHVDMRDLEVRVADARRDTRAGHRRTGRRVASTHRRRRCAARSAATQLGHGVGGRRGANDAEATQLGHGPGDRRPENDVEMTQLGHGAGDRRPVNDAEASRSGHGDDALLSDAGLDDAERRDARNVLAVIRDLGAANADAIVERTELPLQRVQYALVNLELAGQAHLCGYGTYAA